MADLTDEAEAGSIDGADAEIAQAITEAAEGETGPETTEVEGEQVEPETEETEDVQAPEGDAEAEEESETDDDDEETTPEPTPAPVADPRDLKIEAMQKRQDELLGLMAQFIQAQGKAPKPVETAPVPEVSEDAVRFALFGGPDETRWKSLTEKERAAALKVQQQYVDQEVRAALNPKARYDQMRDLILKDVLEQMAPITQEFHNRKAQEIVGRHLDPIKDPMVRQRAEALYRESPGSKSTVWSDQDKSLGWAAKVALAEAKEQKAAANQQKVNASKLQANAAKPKLKTPGKGPGAAKGKPNKGLDLRDGESLEEFFKRNLNNEGK